LLASPIFERFRWVRVTADRFADDHDATYAELGLLAAIWRDVLREIAGQGDPTVTVGSESAVQALAAALQAGQVTEALNTIISAKEALEANVNARLALESMMVTLPTEGVALKGEDAELAPRGARV
jgi:hypothetical protein